MEKKYETHESWGMIGASHCTCNSRKFFQSDVPCHNLISITIKQAEKHRDLSRDWVMGKKTICEVYLTPMQWAEMLTNMNYGDGVPCTIRYTESNGLTDFKEEPSKLDLVLEETDSTIDKGVSILGELKENLQQLLADKKLSRKAYDELTHNLARAVDCLGGNSIDFLKRSAKEEIEKMTVEAKANINSFIDYKIHSTGLKEIERLRIESEDTE